MRLKIKTPRAIDLIAKEKTGMAGSSGLQDRSGGKGVSTKGRTQKNEEGGKQFTKTTRLYPRVKKK